MGPNATFDAPASAPAYTQAGRLLRIDTPLGEDVLLLEAFDGVAAAGAPFVRQ